MQSHEIVLKATAARKDQWPLEKQPELVFCGRSNAGKSSLINALVNRKGFAYSGKTPGKTRLLNFFEVDHRIIFTDAPGYGYAIGIKASAQVFQDLMEPYLQERSTLKGMVLVLDVRRTPSEDDCTMVEYAKSAHLSILAVGTKCDKLSLRQQKERVKDISETLSIPVQSILCVSNTKKEGLEAVWKKMDAMVQG